MRVKLRIAYYGLRIALLASMLCSASFAQIGGTAGAFARMGYNARGMAMGNALTAMRHGAITTYYNPALAPFAEKQTASASVGFLSLDRHINFLNYSQNAPPTAGFSIGLINAGVSRIDGRDNDGIHTEDYSTSENQFHLSFANKFDQRVSLGVTVKLYYFKLLDQVSSTTVGFDFGALISATDELSLGIAVQDIGSKYKWDTTPIYGQSGTNTSDKFPTLYRGGLSYKLPESYGVVSLDVEGSSEKTFVVRMGTEIQIHEFVAIRGGLDRWNLNDNTIGTKPSLGFGLRKPFDDWTPTLDYAFVFEPFTPEGMHIITLSVQF